MSEYCGVLPFRPDQRRGIWIEGKDSKPNRASDCRSTDSRLGEIRRPEPHQDRIGAPIRARMRSQGHPVFYPKGGTNCLPLAIRCAQVPMIGYFLRVPFTKNMQSKVEVW